jgi:hypothetical protein
MDALLLERIETNSARASAALFGCAVGAAVWAVSRTVGFGPALAFACAAGLAAFWLCRRALDTVQDAEHFRLAPFEPVEFESIELDELLLTDLDRPEPAELVLGDADRLHSTEPLVLDDILSAIGPEARVVRLFDRKAMPTPGTLQARIDEWRGGEPIAADASQALSKALAELRRSLR